MKTGRNDPCPCGSGKKYKQCCQRADSGAAETPENLLRHRIRSAMVSQLERDGTRQSPPLDPAIPAMLRRELGLK